MVATPTRAAEKGVVGQCRSLLSQADPPNCCVPVAEVVWPLHERQNLDSDILSIAVNYGNSFRGCVV